MTKSERRLQLFLRYLGCVSLTALGAVVMPYSWMNAVHDFLGMGTLPDDPIVGYLARSTSAFYAALGAIVWMLSFDLRRYRPLVKGVGVIILVFGATLLIVDWVEGLPISWKVVEGPLVIGFGVLILALLRGVKESGMEA